MFHSLVKLIPRRIRFKVLVLLGKDLSVKIEVLVNKEKLGGEYGGYWICPDEISSNSIVYSVGIGKDITFDLALIEKYHCSVFAFDPTPESIEWLRGQDLPEKFKFFPLGLADYNGKALFYSPKNQSATLLQLPEATSRPIEVEVRKLSTLMKMLKHDSIDLLKMNIEGAEYAVINDISRSNLRINQICVDFHHRFPNCSVEDTLHALKTLKEMGFKVFWQDYNLYSFIRP